jgi:hypothetical protein
LLRNQKLNPLKTALIENITAFEVTIANVRHLHFSVAIALEMESSAKMRGTGISKRSPEFIQQKIRDGKAIIALSPDKQWAGFAYIESWENDQFVSNSGLIIHPEFRNQGLARNIKKEIFQLSRKKFPDAKIFGLTTSQAVMKINSEMNYEPVVYSKITGDDKFWEGCKSCVNHSILISKNRKNCLCTAMLFDPQQTK